jgi:hypothetical protein
VRRSNQTTRRPKTKPYAGELSKPIVWPLGFMDEKGKAQYFRLQVLVAALDKDQEFLSRAIEDEAFAAPLVEAERQASEAKLAKIRKVKLLALMAHFGIAPDDQDAWENLATALAVQHVPGLGICRSDGAPKVGRLRDFAIWVRIEMLRCEAQGRSISWICANLRRKFPELPSASPEAYRRAHSRANEWVDEIESIAKGYSTAERLTLLSFLKDGTLAGEKAS